MLNKLLAFVRQHRLLQPGDHLVCAVSGGADSVALLWAMYLLREKLQITLSAAHFNHHLRGEESDRDEAFVRALCDRYDIVLHLGSGTIVPGKKGLEAAARDARYAFLSTLPGKIATAHTANDNAETLLMHLVRGTGLKGMGGIAPIRDNLIRPMLEVTRTEVLAFLEAYNLQYVTDSSNETDAFLRNRLRHCVMPVLEQENPKIAQNLSALALRLREDESALTVLSHTDELPDVPTLRQMPSALRSRAISAFLERCGVPEPEAAHIALTESLVFSENPSARANLPGGIVICRSYDRLSPYSEAAEFTEAELPCPGIVEIPEIGLRVLCEPAKKLCNEPMCFTVKTQGTLTVRSRRAGDTICLSGGTKELKKLFIDRKIPAPQRKCIPVIADDKGVLGVCGIGGDLRRVARKLPAVQVQFERI